MSKLNIASQLIKNSEFDLAKDFLARNPSTQDEYYMLSLLYRYLKQYDDESSLVIRALEQFPSWDYMREREEWHNLPLFDPDMKKSKIVPRPPLHLERKPNTAPSQEILDQLCFVSAGGSDEPYRSFIFELLESIQATRLYKDIPVFIFDTGLTDEDKNTLLTMFKNVKEIKDPGWDIDENLVKKTLSKDNIDGYKASISRPFIPKHFPGYRYYVWFDNDIWIQDERALDEIINLMVQQGFSACPDAHESFGSAISGLYERITLDKYKTKKLLSKPALINGVIGIDTQYDFFTQWQNIFLDHAYNGYLTRFLDQTSINIAYGLAEPDLKLCDFQRIQFLFYIETGAPILKNNILHTNKENYLYWYKDKMGELYQHQDHFEDDVIGIFHLIWYAKWEWKKRFARPLLKEKNIPLGQKIEAHVRDKIPITGDGIVFDSISYRTYPQDQEQIMSILLG